MAMQKCINGWPHRAFDPVLTVDITNLGGKCRQRLWLQPGYNTGSSFATLKTAL